jgi:methionine-rich copper-binding protein CopC
VPIRLLLRLMMVATLLALAVAPVPALAHAILIESQPASGSSVPAGKLVLQFRYNSRIDRGRSKLVLTRPDHSHTTLKIAAEGPPDLLTTTTALTPGGYVVRWQVLAVDGHITRGDVPFTVTGP